MKNHRHAGNVVMTSSRNRNVRKIRDTGFVDPSILHFLAVLCVLLQNLVLEALENVLFFDPKSNGMASLERQVLKNFSTDSAKIFV